jgi:hypothetical protein
MARQISHLLCLIPALALTLAWAAPPGHARVYCNITEVTAKQLRNGIQITVKADGILNVDWHGFDYEQEDTNRFEIRFGNARNETGENFIDVSKFPVSHIELTKRVSASRWPS